MIAAVADTHVALWLLFADPRLSTPAKDFLAYVAAAGDRVALSSISLAEVAYLVEKKRLPEGAFDNLVEAIKDPNHIFEEVFFTARVTSVMRQIPRESVPDMPERMLAATALLLGVPLITRDERIRTSNVETVW